MYEVKSRIQESTSREFALTVLSLVTGGFYAAGWIMDSAILRLIGFCLVAAILAVAWLDIVKSPYQLPKGWWKRQLICWSGPVIMGAGISFYLGAISHERGLGTSILIGVGMLVPVFMLGVVASRWAFRRQNQTGTPG